jgi:hypothetical protein
VSKLRNVAIVGKFASGKTTLADRLIKDYGFTRISFAARMKQIASDVYAGGAVGGAINKTGDYRVTSTDGLVKSRSGREILQFLGQVVKDLDRDFWIKYVAADIRAGVYGAGPYVIDDCRFPFEADYLRNEMNFVITKLDTDSTIRVARYERAYGRPPTIQELRHPSETQVEKIVVDLTIPGEYPTAELARLLVGML